MGKCITPEFRASYCKVFTPAPDLQGEDKYSIQMLFPKDSTDFSEIEKAIKEAVAFKWGDKPPKGLKMPLRDGDKEEDKGDQYKGHFFINANSKNAPGIVDQKRQAIIDPDDFYSGVWARAQVAFYAFDKAGNKGVGCAIHNLQKIRDDDRLDGRQKAEDAFGEVETDSTTSSDEVDIFG